MGARAFLELLHEGYPEGLVEVAAAGRGRDGRLLMRDRRAPGGYLPCAEHAGAAARLERADRAGLECFVGVIPRLSPEPRAAAVGPARALWADVDRPGPLAAVPAAHIEVASGRGRHLYWLLADAVPPAEAERANRRLAALLGADPAACDRLRLLRAPGSRNARAGRRAELAALRPSLPRYALAELLAGAPEAPAPPARAARPLPPDQPLPSDGLAAVAPPAYFGALAGVAVPERGGIIRCPLPGHEDREPSCRVYPERGWHCFGCLAGGSVYDLASALAGGPVGRALRGADFARAAEAARRALAL